MSHAQDEAARIPGSDRQDHEPGHVTAHDVLQSIGEGVIATDLAGRVLSMNAAAERMTGIRSGEALGKPLDDVYRVEREQAAEGTRDAVFDPERRRPTDLLLVARDGTTTPVADNLTRVRDSSGRVNGTVLVFRDRSDVRDIVRKLGELQEEILATAQRLADRNEALSRVSRAKTAFLALMSHELRTPLNVILGFSQLLIDGDGRTPPALATSFLDNIHQSGKQLLRMINDLLDVSMLEQGEVELAPSACALHHCTSDVIAALGPLAQAKHVTLSTRLDIGAEVLVRADPARLSQAIHNVLAHAIKVTPHDGEVQVSLGSPTRSGWSRLSVRDSGSTTRAELSRQLAPFAGLENEKVVGGLDLGLAVSKQLVELMGGTLEIEGNTGSGSTLHVELPHWEGER
jgi:PAS domain S-box-containing protein